MHFCTAKVNIGGDRDNVAILGVNDPISWPEVLILQHIHGEDAVSEVEPFAVVTQNSKDERTRLAEKYGEHVVTTVFGGKQGPAELEASGTKLKEGRSWRNPISLKDETTGAHGVSVPDDDDIFGQEASGQDPVGEVVQDHAEQPVEFDQSGAPHPKGGASNRKK